MKKEYLVKVYQSDGSTFIATLNNDQIKKEPTFTSVINGIFGECRIDLSLPFDDFGEGTTIDFMNVVKVYEFDNVNNTSGTLIYSGFISGYMPYVDRGDQGVVVILLSLGALLNFVYFKTGGGVWTVSYTGSDPSTIMKDIIDYYNTRTSTSLLGYDGDGTTVDTVGNSAYLDFENKKCYNALKDTLGACAGGWYWKIDENGQLYLKEKPTSATHTFTIGKDIELFKAEKSSENIINYVKFVWSGGDVTDQDATSITDFGWRELLKTDTGVTNAPTANWYADQEIQDKKDEKIRASLTINSNYNLENIKVGDTCQILNSKTGNSTFNNNMQIVSVQYLWDKAILQLEEFEGFGDELQKLIDT